MKFDSDMLKSWGHKPGPYFGKALRAGRLHVLAGYDLQSVRKLLEFEKPPAPEPTIPLHPAGAIDLHMNIEPSNSDEAANIQKVTDTMREVLRTPTVIAGAVMPDACPAGPLGTIPVGGVVATKNAIHPGMHSADICCSVMMTDFGDIEPNDVLDAAHSVTHFGPGGRSPDQRLAVDQSLIDAFMGNPFLNGQKIQRMMLDHMGTQGDGNHFLFVGKSRNNGHTCMVTHHGSRGTGAVLYKLGMQVAEQFRQRLSPDTLKQNAWIPADTQEGKDYWDALQLIREWTKRNHESIHDMTGGTAPVINRVWNEHNFVFKRGDIYYHGKGATPAWEGFAADASQHTLIPLNMAEPVLVVKGNDQPNALGFSPHGAGRNFSRSEHKRRMGDMTAEQQLAAETQGLDIRFFVDKIDPSELPSGYKSAASVVEQIKKHDLAEIIDYIDPYGSIMAGDIEPFWKKNQKAKKS